MATDIPFIAQAFDGSDGGTSALSLVLAARPDWLPDAAYISLVRCTDGLTNTLLKVTNARPGTSATDADHDAIMLRAYGKRSDILINRTREMENHASLMRFGLAPRLLARFKNGMIYNFVPGSVPQPADMTKPPLSWAIAQRLAQWHALVPCRFDASSDDSGKDNLVQQLSGQDSKTSVTQPHQVPHTAKPPLSGPNLWTVMERWIAVLPVESEAQKTRQKILREELAKCVDEFMDRPGLGSQGVSCGNLYGRADVLRIRDVLAVGLTWVVFTARICAL